MAVGRQAARRSRSGVSKTGWKPSLRLERCGVPSTRTSFGAPAGGPFSSDGWKEGRKAGDVASWAITADFATRARQTEDRTNDRKRPEEWDMRRLEAKTTSLHSDAGVFFRRNTVRRPLNFGHPGTRLSPAE